MGQGGGGFFPFFFFLSIFLFLRSPKSPRHLLGKAQEIKPTSDRTCCGESPLSAEDNDIARMLRDVHEGVRERRSGSFGVVKFAVMMVVNYAISSAAYDEIPE